MVDVEKRVDKLEAVVSQLKEVQDDVFEPVEDVETCDEELDSGEVCGRELPCRYHSEGEA